MYFPSKLGWFVLLAFVITAVLVRKSNREHFTNPKCAGKNMKPADAAALRDSMKCGVAVKFPGLKKHPDLVDSCYMSMEEPVIGGSVQGCSMSNENIRSVTGVKSVSIDDTLSCTEQMCRIDFVPNLDGKRRDEAVAGLMTANVMQHDAAKSFKTERDAAKQQLSGLQNSVSTLVKQRDAAAASNLQCQTLMSLQQLQATNARNTSTTCIQERTVARNERDVARSERDFARKERDAARGERDTARSDRDVARSERDTARNERDTARNERDACRNSAPLAVSTAVPRQAAFSEVLPSGSWAASCHPMAYDVMTHTLTAHCTMNATGARRVSTASNCTAYWNDGGVLKCDPNGPQQASASGLTVRLCDDVNMRGKCITRGIGSYTGSRLGMKNDGLRSVNVPNGAQLTVFSETNFAGRSAQIKGPREVNMNSVAAVRAPGGPLPLPMDRNVSSYIIEPV